MTGRCVWLGVKLKFSGQWRSRTTVAHPWPTSFFILAALCWIIVKTVIIVYKRENCLEQLPCSRVQDTDTSRTWTYNIPVVKFVIRFIISSVSWGKWFNSMEQYCGIVCGPLWDMNPQPSICENCQRDLLQRQSAGASDLTQCHKAEA